MEGPIYKFFRVRWTEAWYLLSPAERESLLARDVELQKQLGIKNVVLCNACWNNERWAAYGVHEYPNMDAVLKHNAGLVAMDLFRYAESETMLGTPWGA
jgi:hypothetical protein